MNMFNEVSKILQEQPERRMYDIRSDPKLVAMRQKAEILKAKADLLKAKNQIIKAKLDRKDIINQADKKNQDSKSTAVYPNQEESQPQPQAQPQTDANLDSGDPINKKAMSEDIIDPLNYKNSVNEAEENEKEMTRLPGEDQQDNEQVSQQETPPLEIAGSKPQTKEEADIARIQAQTRAIQSKIGEYTPPGGTGMGGGIDPMTGNPTGSNETGMIDPTTGQPMMGSIDPMTGQPMMQQPPDPLKGFGDLTDPALSSGLGAMGAIDPMTGMPSNEPSKTPTTIGRLFVLKKIYYRLALLDHVLTNCPDPEVSELARVTDEAFELFRLILNNLKTYKEKIDEVIVDYYMLIKDITQQVEDHFKLKNIAS